MRPLILWVLLWVSSALAQGAQTSGKTCAELAHLVQNRSVYQHCLQEVEAGSTDAYRGLYELTTFTGTPLFNPQEALMWAEKAIEAGDLMGYRLKGELYLSRFQLGEDFQKAAQVFQQGVAAGSAYALTSLASLYSKGHGVEKDLKKALEMMEEAVRLKDPLALEALGTFYLSTEDPAFRDPQRGWQLLNGLVEMNHPRGYLARGMVQLDQNSPYHNTMQGLQDLWIAGEKGEPLGFNQLGAHYLVRVHPPDYDRALEIALRESELSSQGHVHVCELLLSGVLPELDFERGQKHCLLAGTQGNPYGYSRLAWHHQQWVEQLEHARLTVQYYQLALNLGGGVEADLAEVLLSSATHPEVRNPREGYRLLKVAAGRRNADDCDLKHLFTYQIVGLQDETGALVQGQDLQEARRLFERIQFSGCKEQAVAFIEGLKDQPRYFNTYRAARRVVLGLKP